ncbi:MAG: hypothetical protein NVSMB1_21250 [Polyangiales bacterium]
MAKAYHRPVTIRSEFVWSSLEVRFEFGHGHTDCCGHERVTCVTRVRRFGASRVEGGHLHPLGKCPVSQVRLGLARALR